MKSIFLPAFLAVIFFFFTSKSNAQGGILPQNGSVNGTVTSSTPDVWDITTNADGLLRLTLTAVSPADLYVTLYDNDGSTVLSATAESFNNGTAIVNVDGLMPGTYHVKIVPFSTSFGAYTLSDDFFTTTLTNDTEPNGNAATAIALAVNGSSEGHVGYYYNNLRDTADWYKVSTGADGLLRVYLSSERGGVNSNNSLDVNVTLFDNNGTTQLGAVEVFNANNPASNFITADGLAPGTYYIKVQPYASSEFANYTISDSLFIPALANDAEPNGNKATAQNIALNSSQEGHIGYYYNQQRDTSDWYKVTTASDGLLKIYLGTNRGSVYSNNTLDVNLTLYDNDGATQLGAVEVFNAGNPGTNIITADGLAAGTYYIKVQTYSSNQFADYTLTDSLFTSSSNDNEPNGNRANAVTLTVNDSSRGHVGYYYNQQRDTADWYKVSTASDGLLRIYLRTSRGSVYSNNALDVNVTLYDNDGATQLGAVEVFNANNPGSNLISADGLAPGTYYIKVQPYATSEFADYTISDSLFLPSVANDAEPNGSPAQAATILINAVTAGHNGYYYNAQRDTTDWFKIILPVDGPLYIYLNTLRGSSYSTNSLDMLMTVFSSDASTQLGTIEIFNANNPATNSLSFPLLTAGTYYIKISSYSSSEFGNYNLSVAGTNVNLPVTWLHFDGSIKENTAQLIWSTATEINNKGFEIQKSMDGLTFTRIGFVEANGTSALINNYRFTDTKLSGGHNYYRLKQVDLDGHAGYSSTILLDYNKFDWYIAGNPVSATSHIQLQLLTNTRIAVMVFTADGKLIKTINKGTLVKGSYNIPLQLTNIAAGIYIVKLIADGKVFSTEIIK